MRLLTAVLAGLLFAPSLSTAQEVSEPRTLFLALDAVDYAIVAELTSEEREDRLFDFLDGPVPVISSFPSATTVAFTGIFEPLGIDRPPGYEARFYDLETDRMRGGGLFSYNRIKAPWRDFFDWRVHSIVKKNIGFVRPVKFGIREIDQAIESFFESDDPFFFAYVGGTDGIGHLKGPEAMEELLVSLDAALRRARREGPEHHVVVFSDHGIGGGEPLQNVRKAVKQAVKGAGFDLGKRVREEDDITIVSYGLLSSFIVFTDPEREERAARALVSAAGVEICALRDNGDPDRFAVFGEEGIGRIHRRQRRGIVEWSYRVEGTDPLRFLDGDSELPAGLFGESGEVDWLPDREWFEATAGTQFPDALHRIARAFDLVENPASLVCSVEPGHMYGGKLAEVLGRTFMGPLRWTHGALRRDDTLGFLLADHPAFRDAEALRFDVSLLPFLEQAAMRDVGPSAAMRDDGHDEAEEAEGSACVACAR